MATPYPINVERALQELAYLASAERTDHHTLDSILAAYTALAPLETLPERVMKSREPWCEHACVENALDKEGMCDVCSDDDETGGFMFKYGCNGWLARFYQGALEQERKKTNQLIA